MRKKKPYIPIQTLLAYNATEDAVKLLNKYGYKPKNVEDIQIKLTEAYKSVPDKVEFEKELINIHPHLGLFKKYLSQNPEKTQDKTIVEVSPEKTEAKETKNTIIHDGYSNCEGSQACPCMRGMSNFDGTGLPREQSSKGPDTIQVIGLVSIVAIFGLIIYKG